MTPEQWDAIQTNINNIDRGIAYDLVTVVVSVFAGCGIAYLLWLLIRPRPQKVHGNPTSPLLRGRRGRR
jgi:hypothetical protein